MSPEQALGEQDIDHRCDIWSLGVILYECLTGFRPVQGESVGQIVKQILVDGVRPIDELEGDLPPAVIQLVGRMLSRKRSRRPSDLNRVADVLRSHTRIEVPSFGPPEHSANWLPEAHDERETSVDRKSGTSPDRKARQDETVAPQSAPNGAHLWPHRSTFALAIGAGLVLVGIAVWQGRTHAIKSSETNAADASSVQANATTSPTPSSTPLSTGATPQEPPIGPAAEPSPAAPSKALSPSNKPKEPSVSAASKGSVGSAHPSPSSSAARAAASGNVAPPAQSAAPPNRFSGGLSEKVPF
jgi:serine/threonine protein kinase